MPPSTAPQPPVPGLLTRHPLDPEPVADSKAAAVLGLGIVAVLTGFFIGGVVPASLALLLAGQARREMVAAGGYLTGSRRIRIGTMLAWAGVALAGVAVVSALIVVLLHMADAAGARDYPAGVN